MPLSALSNQLRFRVIASATLVSMILLIPFPAQSISQKNWSGDVRVHFPVGSAQLSPAAAVLLARQLPRMNALALEVIIIEATGDHMLSVENENRERSLALARAKSVRHFFVRAGYPEPLIYAEAQRVSVSKKREGFFPEIRFGTADIFYLGGCKPGYISICDEKP
jgi:hypothetical protein